MVFSTYIFLFIFLPLVLVLYFNPFLKGRKFKNTLLLISSLLFYAWGETYFVFIMILSIIMNYVLARLIDSGSKRKFFLTLAVLWNIGLIFVFKYLSFVLENLHMISTKIPLVTIALPIGISFFTFQSLTYVIDVYKKEVPVQENIFDLALYIALFPQLIAGPIVRYSTVQNEISNRTETRDDFTQGSFRFILGLAKKCLVANYAAQIADSVFSSMGTADFNGANAWIGAIAYTIQIYFDFSGYSDMAIGLGRIFGFHFEENFNYPYISKSITEFWRRWHISLSSFFRDYVYIPLGGSRVSPHRHILNLAAVWVLTGIWHGAAWNFIIWGIFYLVLQLMEKFIFMKFLKFSESKATRLLQKTALHAYSLLFIIIGWIIFRCTSLADIVTYIKTMFSFSGSIINNFYLRNGAAFILAIGVLGSMPLAKLIKNKESTWYGIARSAWILLMFILSALTVIKGGYNPFIYFNF